MNTKHVKKYMFLFIFSLLVPINLLFSLNSQHKQSSQKKFPKKIPLKILFIEKCFPPNCSTAVLNQITGLIDLGHDVHIFAKNRGDLEHAHSDCITYNLFEKTYWEHLPSDLDTYDVIYCQFGEIGKELVDFLQEAPLQHAKIITCFRGADVTKYSPEYYQKLFAQGTLFLPVCDYFKQKLIALGCNADKITVHRSSIDSNFFAFKDRSISLFRHHAIDTEPPINLISVCRITDKKGLEYCLEAVAKLLPRYPTLHYTIIGTGKRYNRIVNITNRLGIANHVTLTGHQTQEQVIEHLNKADIFILTSVTPKDKNKEGIPNSLKEAMACGLPVISTYHAGIPELIEHNKSGLLVPERDARAIAAQISYLIENKHIWPELCQNARREIETNYEKKIVNSKLEHLFYQLCAQ